MVMAEVMARRLCVVYQTAGFARGMGKPSFLFLHFFLGFTFILFLFRIVSYF